MSFWKTLFGGGSGADASAPAGGPTTEHLGFKIRATPYQEGGQFQTAGVIEKEIEGAKREHKFIRADRHVSYEDAAAFSVSKARQMIDQMGERLFSMK